MKAPIHPLFGHSLVGVLIAGAVLVGSMLPLAGAESTKKSSSSSSSSATPKKKKSSSATPSSKSKSATPKPSPSKKSSTKSKSSSTADTSEEKSDSSESTKVSTKKDKTDSDETEKDKESSESEVKSTPAKATPKPTPAKKKTQSGKKKADTEAVKSEDESAKPEGGTKKEPTEKKSEVPGQPATELPSKDESSPTPAPAEKAATGGNGDKPESAPVENKPKFASNVAISTDELLGFAEQPPKVQQLITDALELARQKLTYTYGSADPVNGGMDCSGAIYYLLRQHGFEDVPRDASGQYVWARKNGQFFAVISKKADSFEFGDLLPGDLLFWSGTYRIDRDPPVTHTMIYLGVQKKRGQHVMWGSSDGRTYDGKPRWGVSVFDFKMPRVDKNNAEPSKADFLGYARIPGLRDKVNNLSAR